MVDAALKSIQRPTQTQGPTPLRDPAQVDFVVEFSGGAPLAQRYPGARLTTFRLATIAAHVVALAFHVERIPVKGKRRGARKVAAARQYAMALVHLVTGRSQDDVARQFRRNRTTASNHMEMVEWLNDVPEHDDFWQDLEQRYRLFVELAALGDGRAAWLKALHGIERAMDDGDLEGESYDQAKYIALTFWEDRTFG